jgi:hypothetical protein
MMKRLSDLIPNYEDVLRLEPEQLAGVLLEILLEIDGSDRQFLHRGNFFNQFIATQNYPNAHGGDVARRRSRLECGSNTKDSSYRG